MTPFHSTSKADFCVLKIFSKPRRVKNSPATGVSVCIVTGIYLERDLRTHKKSMCLHICMHKDVYTCVSVYMQTHIYTRKDLHIHRKKHIGAYVYAKDVHICKHTYVDPHIHRKRPA